MTERKRNENQYYYDEFVKNLKKLLGDTPQRAVAAKIGVPTSMFSKICSGAQKPSIDFIARIANEYDVSIDWLIGRGEGNPKEHGLDLSYADFLTFLKFLDDKNAVRICVDVITTPENCPEDVQYMGFECGHVFFSNKTINDLVVEYYKVAKVKNSTDEETGNQLFNLWVESKCKKMQASIEHTPITFNAGVGESGIKNSLALGFAKQELDTMKDDSPTPQLRNYDSDPIIKSIDLGTNEKGDE